MATGFPGIISVRNSSTEASIEVAGDVTNRAINVANYVYNATSGLYEKMVQPATQANITDSLKNYHISDLDEDGSTQYYGYVDKDANWYIMQKTDTTARYFKGDSNYTTNWGNRGTLGYDYFYTIF
jgi:hypothetical protein